MMKPCLSCGEPSHGTYCAEHAPKREQPSPSELGYDRAWRKLSERARTLQPFCSTCGTTANLTLHHSELAWLRHYAGKPARLTDYSVECGACNTRIGSTRPKGWPLTRSEAQERLSDYIATEQPASDAQRHTAPDMGISPTPPGECSPLETRARRRSVALSVTLPGGAS